MKKNADTLVLRPGGAALSAGAPWGCRLPSLLLSLAFMVSLTGCSSFLKPAQSTERRFVLTPVTSAGPGLEKPSSPAVGVGPVKLPAHLFNSSLAIRKGTNEIVYLETVLWAERLDTGIQRVMAANLAALLPTAQVRLPSWGREDVAAEVHLAIEQFDVNLSGGGVFVARWRIVAPGGEKTLKAGESRLTRQGAAPDKDSAGAVATLSELIADCSRQIAQAIGNALPPGR